MITFETLGVAVTGALMIVTAGVTAMGSVGGAEPRQPAPHEAVARAVAAEAIIAPTANSAFLVGAARGADVS